MYNLEADERLAPISLQLVTDDARLPAASRLLIPGASHDFTYAEPPRLHPGQSTLRLSADHARNADVVPTAGARVTKLLSSSVARSLPVRAGASLLPRTLPAASIQVTRHAVRMRHLPASLDGLRILHVTDLHLHAGPQPAWQLPAITASVPHDLLCYTGDFIDSDDDLTRLAHFLARMPCSAPAFAVLGNHDYVSYGGAPQTNDVERLRAVLAAAGVTVLTNSAHSLFGDQLYVAGVDDPATRRDDLDRTLSGIPADAATLLLSHSPDLVLRLGEHRPGLILAGHTHGGQIRLPRIGPLLTESRLPRRFAAGPHAYGGVPLFVSRGIGFSGIDVRLGCPPEAAVVTLRSAHTVNSDHDLGRPTEAARRGT